jgi:pimeloyl-ACP methyl ester carboxylesterase
MTLPPGLGAADVPGGDGLGWHSRFLGVDGARVHYLEAGSGDTTLVLVHGGIVWCSAETEFGAVMPFLASRTRVIALDVVGFGRTPARGVDDLASPTMGAFLVSFLRALGGPVFVGGNSHGGWLATYAALEAPDAVEGLVVINSGSTVVASRSDGGAAAFDPRWALPERLPSRDDVRRDLIAFYRQPHVVTEERIDRCHELAVEHYEGAAERQRLHGMTAADRNRSLAYRGRHISYSADALEMPVLLTWSRENRGASPEDAMQFFNRLRDAQMHVWVNAGHHLQLEHPASWAHVVTSFMERDGRR